MPFGDRVDADSCKSSKESLRPASPSSVVCTDTLPAVVVSDMRVAGQAAPFDDERGDCGGAFDTLTSGNHFGDGRGLSDGMREELREVESLCVDGEVGEHNAQITRILSVLGESGSGRRAIIKAIAERQGIVDEGTLEELYGGKSSVKLRVPMAMRETLRSAGLAEVIAPINLITVTETAEVLTASDAWRDIEFEVALDSGSVVHVCSIDDCKGYKVGDSPGSRRGQEFLMGDGGTIPNLGQSELNLTDEAVDRDIKSVFQIAAVTRPLMSVGKICDEGHSVTFDSVMAVVHAAYGSELCKFVRNSSGLYVAKLKLRSPAGFGGQE